MMFIFILIYTHVDQRVLLFLSFLEGLHKRRERESRSMENKVRVYVCV